MNALGNLAGCMVDGDSKAIGRARRLRSKALVISLALQAALILGVLLLPLITLGVLPAQLVFTPVPPFHGARNTVAATRAETKPQPQAHRITMDRLFHQPPMIPSHVVRTDDAQLMEPLGIVDGSGAGDSPGLSGGMDGGPPAIPRPANTTSKSGPRLMSSDVMSAALVYRVQPDYPSIAKVMRLSGTVLLRARIGTDGAVRELEVLSGNPILANAAIAAVREWRYRPTRLNGAPVEVETRITVNFVLEQR